MSLDPRQLLAHVVSPALKALGSAMDTRAAQELLMGTAAQESRLQYLAQLSSGPARGLWQMEPATHTDIWVNFLRFKPDLADRLRGILSALNQEGVPRADELCWNLKYAAAMCRVHYLRFEKKNPLPPAGDLQGQARCWKAVYNTPLGAGTVEEYVRNFARVAVAFPPLP